MSIIEAIILGIIQGLTEFLPVSSSGHLELAKEILNINVANSLQFTVAVHAATVLSTITVFFKEISRIFKGLFKFTLNDETIYAFNIVISMVPILFVGLFFKDEVSGLFDGSVLLVGCMLLVTAGLLTLTYYAKPREGKITPKNAFIIGIAQAVAVLPGLSRSGATISTGLLLGVKRSEVSKFSFLMVLVPILGETLLDLIKSLSSSAPGLTEAGIGFAPIIAGFIAAYAVGVVACRWMIKIVNNGKLIWFAVYCALVGLTAIGFGVFS